MTLEIILMWLALTAYVAATAMFVFGVIFMKDGLTRNAVYASAVGLIFQDRRRSRYGGSTSGTVPISATTRLPPCSRTSPSPSSSWRHCAGPSSLLWVSASCRSRC